MVINEAEAGVIRRWNDRQKNKVHLLLRLTGDRRSHDFEAYMDNLTQLASSVHTVMERLDAPDPPAIHVGSLFCFHILPLGRELSPFLNILSMLDAGAHRESEKSSLTQIQAVQWPADLRIYVAPQCAFCPQIVEQLSPLPFINPLIRITIIDGLLFPEMAEPDGVRSVPTVILDGRFRWTGQSILDEILRALVHRDISRISTETIQSFLKDGNAVLLAEMMLREERIFPALVDLLMHPEWSVRLGAMVVAEEIADRNIHLAAKILKPLWKRLKYADENVKGDVLYLFGHLGSEEWIPKLEKLLRKEKAGVLRDVLEEAIQNLLHLEAKKRA